MKQNSIAGLGAAVACGEAPTLLANYSGKADNLAILGGQPVRIKRWQWFCGNYSCIINK